MVQEQKEQKLEDAGWAAHSQGRGALPLSARPTQEEEESAPPRSRVPELLGRAVQSWPGKATTLAAHTRSPEPAARDARHQLPSETTESRGTHRMLSSLT